MSIMQIISDLARTLIEEHPIDTARILARLSPTEAWATLLLIEEHFRVEIVESFPPEFAAKVLKIAGLKASLELIREIPSEITTDIFEHLSEDFKAKILDQLPNLHSEEIESLAEYEEDTAGSIMSPDFVALRNKAKVSDALTRLRRLGLVNQPVNYVYVVDEEEKLKGVLVMRDLVLAPLNKLLEDVMLSELIKVYTDDKLDYVIDKLVEERLLALPVVDHSEKLKGVVEATDLVKDLQEEGFEDAQKMFGAGSDEHASSSPIYTIRRRLPWLQVNLITAFLAATVVGIFESMIAQMTILAAFLPVVAGQGGNAGAQALAVMLRALALEEVDPRKPMRVLLKESLVGFINGMAVGLSAGLIAAIFTGNLALGLVIFLAMMVNLIVAGISGAAIPMLMQRLGQDPAQSSNIILTTITDVIGFAAFLGFAVLARPWLIS